MKAKRIIVSIMLALALCVPVADMGITSYAETNPETGEEIEILTPMQINNMQKKIRRGYTKKKMKKIMHRGLGEIVRTQEWEVGHMEEYVVTFYCTIDGREDIFFSEWHLMFVKKKLEDWNIETGRFVNGVRQYNFHN